MLITKLINYLTVNVLSIFSQGKKINTYISPFSFSLELSPSLLVKELTKFSLSAISTGPVTNHVKSFHLASTCF